MYTFSFSIDATREPALDEPMSVQLGRLVNHGRVPEKNAHMRLKEVKGVPHLFLYATRAIYPGEEILYDYGPTKLPFEDKVCVYYNAFPVLF